MTLDKSFYTRLGTRYFRFAIFSLMATTSLIGLSQICATPGKDGDVTGLSALGAGGTTVVVNTYYQGNASASVGATSISVGSPRGAGTSITAGDLLLVIQMQDATINSTDSSSYGDGVSGGSASGTTSDGNVGVYEYVQATGPVSGGSVPIQGATAGSGLINAYVNAAATFSQGQRRFQVIRVPQYDDADVEGTVNPAPWNGRSGGVVAIDVNGTLTFVSGGTISATGFGFRGGGGRQLSGDSGGTNSDYRSSSNDDYHAPKGEGIAGTPSFVHESFTGAFPGSLVNTGTGYPSGSHGRGAPGNAGGGGTDGNPGSNDENSGGGGGGNGGTGGMGGNSWNSNLPTGGHGGATFGSASINNLIMGGGGGAGSRNNSSDVDSSGGAGGGLIIIRAATITGTGTISSNGVQPDLANGLQPANDGGGGGGAGGTLVVFGNSGSLANIALLADGADGGDCAANDPAHGPGGGGGGGIVYVNDLLTGTISVDGGVNGVTTTSNLDYGATDGTDGAIYMNAQITSLQACGYVPVSLAYFRALRAGSKVIFEWATATETGNIGFNLLGYDGLEWVRLNDQLIPSHVVDSDRAQNYRFEANVSFIDQFAIEDVDRFGKATRHGSFEMNQTYGARPQMEAIGWANIAYEHELADLQHRDFGTSAAPKATIWVTEPGLQRVSFETLQMAGIDFSGMPIEDLALTSNGQPIPIRVGNDQPKSGSFFGPGWYVEFIGEVEFNLYSDRNAYHLVANSKTAHRIPDAPNFKPFAPRPVTHYREQFKREENHEYAFNSQFDDPWFDTKFLTLEEPTSFDFDFELDNLKIGFGAQLNLRAYGVTNFPIENDHHLQFFLNGYWLGEWVGEGTEVLEQAIPVPSSYLHNGFNRLRIVAPGDTGAAADVINFEGFSLSYQRELRAKAEGLTFSAEGRTFSLSHLPANNPVVYAETSEGIFHLPEVPVDAVKNQYWTATLTNPTNQAGPVTFHVVIPNHIHRPEVTKPRGNSNLLYQGADFLIISHPNFIDGLAPLVSAREAEGFRTFIADVNHVYDQFSYGNIKADAIADYIKYAYETMGTRYVLLVGGDSYDYKNYLGEGAISFVPTQYVRTSNLVGFTPSDAAFADVDNDRVPDLAIGRFPVRTAQEIDLIVQKTLKYENAPFVHDSLFVAGSDESAVSFKGYSEHFMDKLPTNWSKKTAFIDDLGVASARNTLVDSVNEGLAFLHFFGHSGPTVWTFENLFSTQHIQQLRNNQAPTMVVQWGCWNTYFVAPSYNTMAHKWLLSGSNGAAAVFGSSSLSEVSSEKQFAPKFLEKLFIPGQSLGEAMTEAKQEVAKEYPELADVQLGFHLLGDPTMVLNPR